MENRGSTIETRELAVAGGRRYILSRERARRRRTRKDELDLDVGIEKCSDRSGP